MWDLLIKNTRVIDPINHLDSHLDIAIENGKIAEIGVDLSGPSRQIEDFSGFVSVPGIIDMHTHLRTLWGSPHGQRMVALAGVTTAMDMAGPLNNILDTIPTSGAGINMAILQQATAPFTFETNRPSLSEQKSMIDDSLNHGALGIKLLGGHYPMDLDICNQLITNAREKNAWIAWHAGNSTHGSNILGAQDAIEASQGAFLHLAHVNSYCRGQISNPIDEAKELIECLKANPNIFSESYLSPNNGTRLTCENNVPTTKVTCSCLNKMGFDASEKGMADCLLAGKVGVVFDNGQTSELIYGQKAYDFWKQEKTVVSGCFAVNPLMSRMMMLEAKRDDGSFVVDNISTDGGALPRNVIVELGLAAVKLGAISLSDFAIKTSVNPAKALRLETKGHFSIGADADITVLDVQRQKAEATIVAGGFIMKHGELMGRGTKILCTPHGEKYLKSRNIDYQILDLTKPWSRYIPTH